MTISFIAFIALLLFIVGIFIAMMSLGEDFPELWSVSAVVIFCGIMLLTWVTHADVPNHPIAYKIELPIVEKYDTRYTVYQNENGDLVCVDINKKYGLELSDDYTAYLVFYKGFYHLGLWNSAYQEVTVELNK